MDRSMHDHLRRVAVNAQQSLPCPGPASPQTFHDHPAMAMCPECGPEWDQYLTTFEPAVVMVMLDLMGEAERLFFNTDIPYHHKSALGLKLDRLEGMIHG